MRGIIIKYDSLYPLVTGGWVHTGSDLCKIMPGLHNRITADLQSIFIYKGIS